MPLQQQQSHRVAVFGIDGDDQTTGDYFDVEAADKTDAISEAIMAARDCGWKVEHADYVGTVADLAADEIKASRIAAEDPSSNAPGLATADLVEIALAEEI